MDIIALVLSIAFALFAAIGVVSPDTVAEVANDLLWPGGLYSAAAITGADRQAPDRSIIQIHLMSQCHNFKLQTKPRTKHPEHKSE